MINFRYMFLAFATLFAAGLVSCKDDWYDNSPKEPLEVSQTKIVVGKDGGEVYIGVTAREDVWSMTGDEAWCTPSPTSGEKGITRVTVTFAANDADGAVERSTTFAFTSGTHIKNIDVIQLTTDILLPDIHPDYPVNEAVHEDIINVWYYWNGETKDSPGDYNQSYINFFDNYLNYLKTNAMDGGSWSRSRERYFFSYIERLPLGSIAADTPPLNFGFEYDLETYNGRLVGRILWVLKNSPADKAGLKRADWFWKVNGRELQDYTMNNGWQQYNYWLDSVVNPVENVSRELGMLRFNHATGELIDDGTVVTITPARFHGNPILRSVVYTSSDIANITPTGYLAYNSFDPAYESELRAVFSDFKAQNVQNVILDLRYNRTGTVEMAEIVGNLIAPAAANGQTFADYRFNSDASSNNRIATFTADANGVGVDSLFILTSGFTAGAAELLINAFRGIDPTVRTVVIGDVTEGMNVGQVKRSYSNSEWDWEVVPVAFRVYNGQGKGSYEYGLVPNGSTINEWATGNVKLWSTGWGWRSGNEQDPLLYTAMDYIAYGLPTGTVDDAESRTKSGLQREFTEHMTMTMDVP